MTSISRLVHGSACQIGEKVQRNSEPQVDRRVPDAVTNALDDRRNAVVVDIICRDELEPDRRVVLEVRNAL